MTDREFPELPTAALNALVALAALLTVAACGVMGWMVFELWLFTVDDTFITLRYAEHLAAGYGPVYNLEPPRAEGYTSFLWMIILTIPHLASIDTLSSAKVLGACFGAGTVTVAFVLTAHLSAFLGPRLRYLPAAFTAFWLAGFTALAVHSVSGMETTLASFLFVLFVYCAVTAKTTATPVLGLLLGLTRPEANAVVAPILIYGFLAAAISERRPFARSAVLLYVLPGVLYFTWRAWYFGHLFPIPFYMKIASQDAFAGSEHALDFARKVLAVASFPLAGCLIRAHRPLLLVLAAGLLWLGVSALPASIMDYDYRFAFPAAPILFAAAGYGLAVWLRFAMEVRFSSPRRAMASLSAAVVVIAVASHLVLFQNFDSVRFNRHSYGMAVEVAHIRLGKILAKFSGSAGPGSAGPVIALGDAGAVAYYSRWRTIDTFGLNDPEIGIRGNFDPSYFLDQRPDLVVLVSERRREFRATEFFPREVDFADPVKAAGYQLLAVMPFSLKSYLWIMGDPESDIGRHVRAEVAKLIEK